MSDNFIDSLSSEEKAVFLKSLIFMIKIDGKIDDAERQMAHDLVSIYKLENCGDILKNIGSKEELLSEILRTVKDRKKAILLIRELLIIAHIDEDFDEKEMQFIKEVAQKLNIDDRLVLELNQLILDYKLWQFKMEKILEA